MEDLSMIGLVLWLTDRDTLMIRNTCLDTKIQWSGMEEHTQGLLAIYATG